MSFFQLNAAEGMEGNPLADKMKKFMRIFAIILFPISMNFEKVELSSVPCKPCFFQISLYF